jgi:hypothetical protein
MDRPAGELPRARERLAGAYEAAVASLDLPILALVGVEVASAAEDPVAAAEILGAAARLRGAEDLTNPEIASLTEALRATLGGAAFAAAHARGRALDRDAAVRRLDPAAVGDQGERDEDGEQRRHRDERPQQV